MNSHLLCNNSYFWTIFFKTGHILLSVSDVLTKLNFKWCEAVQPPLKKGDKFNVSHFLSRTQWDKIFSRGATILFLSIKPYFFEISYLQIIGWYFKKNIVKTQEVGNKNAMPNTISSHCIVYELRKIRHCKCGVA